MTQAVSVLARYGRSFRLAGRLLPGDTLARAAELYAFCRAIDDLADEATDKQSARRALVDVRRAVLCGDDSHAVARRFLALQRSHGVDRAAAVTLIDTVMTDLDPVRLADEAALLGYAYGVAGTVGLMMCAVLDARDATAAAPAIDLGIAMQLTNIARDVVEDAARGRIYLPATWLPPQTIPHDITADPVAVFAAVEKLLRCADNRYRSAESGIALLPPRVRPAIRAAAWLYEEIGLRIRAQGPRYLRAGRCVVPMPRRLWLVGRSLVGDSRRPTLHAPRLDQMAPSSGTGA